MPYFNYFCCGYRLRSGGSFIGFFSISVYAKILLLCIIVLWTIKSRIDDIEGSRGWSFFNKVSNVLRVRSSNQELENSLQELRGEDKVSEIDIYKKIITFFLTFKVTLFF